MTGIQFNTIVLGLLLIQTDYTVGQTLHRFSSALVYPAGSASFFFKNFFPSVEGTFERADLHIKIPVLKFPEPLGANNIV